MFCCLSKLYFSNCIILRTIFFYPVISPSEGYINNHKIHQVQSKPRGIFVDLDVSSHYTPGRSHHIEFQVDSGCSCNTMHITDLEKPSDVDVMPSPHVSSTTPKQLFPPKVKPSLIVHAGAVHMKWWFRSVLSSPA